MTEVDESKVRDLAYQLWERDGRPEGKDHEFWHAAEKLLADEGEAVEPADPVAVLATPAIAATTRVK
ncbi:MAG: DUF2934 domain-containing protein [Cypionkella sp.]